MSAFDIDREAKIPVSSSELTERSGNLGKSAFELEKDKEKVREVQKEMSAESEETDEAEKVEEGEEGEAEESEEEVAELL